MVRFLKSKVGAGDDLKSMILELERTQNGKGRKSFMRRIRSDNGTEFLSKDLKQWFCDRGIVQEFSATYSPESNVKAERLNRTLLDMSHTMVVAAAALPNKNRLWAEAVNFSSHLRNRTFTSAGNYKDMTPFECITGEKPDLSNIRKFGAKTNAHIPKAKRQGEFERRADKGFCVGVGSGSG